MGKGNGDNPDARVSGTPPRKSVSFFRGSEEESLNYELFLKKRLSLQKALQAIQSQIDRGNLKTAKSELAKLFNAQRRIKGEQSLFNHANRDLCIVFLELDQQTNPGTYENTAIYTSHPFLSKIKSNMVSSKVFSYRQRLVAIERLIAKNDRASARKEMDKLFDEEKNNVGENTLFCAANVGLCKFFIDLDRELNLPNANCTEKYSSHSYLKTLMPDEKGILAYKYHNIPVIKRVLKILADYPSLVLFALCNFEFLISYKDNDLRILFQKLNTVLVENKGSDTFNRVLQSQDKPLLENTYFGINNYDCYQQLRALINKVGMPDDKSLFGWLNHIMMILNAKIFEYRERMSTHMRTVYTTETLHSATKNLSFCNDYQDIAEHFNFILLNLSGAASQLLRYPYHGALPEYYADNILYLDELNARFYDFAEKNYQYHLILPWHSGPYDSKVEASPRG